MRKHTFHKLLLLMVGLSSVGLFLLSPKTAVAANPSTISFQGKVVNANGTNLTNNTYPFVFRIYNTPTPTTATACSSDATCLFEETQASVQVTNSIFQVELGSGCAGGLVASNSCTKSVSGGLNFSSNNALYLVLKFNNDAAGFMNNPIHFNSVPFALNADNATHVDAGTVTTLGVGDANATAITIGNVANSTLLFQAKSSSTAYQFQDASNKNLLAIDTSGSQVLLGTAGSSGINGKLVFNTTNASNTTISIVAASTGTSYSLTLPTTGPSTSKCLQTDASVATQLKFAACAAGGGSTLAASYALGTSTADTKLLLDSTMGGGIVLKDNATSVGSAFQIQSSNATSLLNFNATTSVLTQSTFGASYVGGNDGGGALNSGTAAAADSKAIAVRGNYAYVLSGGSISTACSGAVGSGGYCEMYIYDISTPSAPKYVGGVDASGQLNTGTSTQIFSDIAISGKYAYISNSGSVTACSQSPGSAAGCELQVYDLTNPIAPVYIGGADASGQTNTGTSSSAFNTIAVSGRYVYVGGSSNATACSQSVSFAIGCELQVYDVSDPTKPTYVGGGNADGTTNGGSTGNKFTSISIAGKYAYIAKDSSGTCSQAVATGCSFTTWDISTPSAPTYVGGGSDDGNTNSGSSTNQPTTILATGHYIYVGTTGTNATCNATAGFASSCAWTVWDVSTPSAPLLLSGANQNGTTNGGSSVGLAGIGDINVVGHYAYITKNNSTQTCSQTAGSAEGCELQIYDVSVPASPAYIGGSDPAGTTNSGSSTGRFNSTYLVGSNLYATNIFSNLAACSSTVGSARGCELQVYNVSGMNSISLSTNSIDSGSIAISQDASIGANLSIGSSLDVGTSLNVVSSSTLRGDLLATGAALFKNSSDSSSAFRIQSSAGTSLISIDTSALAVTVGSLSGASATTIQAGSGDITLDSGNGHSVVIGSATSDANQILLQLDSFSTFADTASCTTSANQGAVYYSTSSNAIRGCINGAWEDVVTTAGLGLILFGVAPDSGSNPGDLASLVTAGASGPCKVSYLSASSVNVAPCIAYSSGRKVVVASTTPVTGLTTASRFYHICFDPTTGLLQALAGTSETNALPTFNVNNPVLCLADVQTNATPVISAVYDTRTFTNSIKQSVTVSATAAGLGMLVTLNGANVTKPAATAALVNVQGVVVATDGGTSTTNPNAIIVINGPAVVKATAGSAGALIETGGTTAGYAITIAASGTATQFTQIGYTKNTFPGTACTATPNATNCNRSLYFYATQSK